MSIIIKVCWRETYLRGMPLVTEISMTPYIGMPKLSIPIRRVFTGVSLKRCIPIQVITQLERIMNTLPSTTNTRCTWWLERTVVMTRASSHKKVIPLSSLGVKTMGSSYWFNKRTVVRAYFLYFLFLLLESPSIDVPPKIILISGGVGIDWPALLCSIHGENPSLKIGWGRF